MIPLLLMSLALIKPALLAEAKPSAKQPVSCKAGNLSNEPQETAAKISSFFLAFQNAVRADQPVKVAKMMAYPLPIASIHQQFEVHSEREFIQAYPRIITPQLRKFVLEQSLACVSRVGVQGFSMGDGQLWFDTYPTGDVKIFTINSVLYPKQ